MNVLHKNIDIWGIISLVQNKVKRFSTVKFFEYEGEIENSELLYTSSFKKYNMGLDLLSQVMLAIYGHIDKFNVIIDVYGSDVVINLNLLNRKVVRK